MCKFIFFVTYIFCNYISCSYILCYLALKGLIHLVTTVCMCTVQLLKWRHGTWNTRILLEGTDSFGSLYVYCTACSSCLKVGLYLNKTGVYSVNEPVVYKSSYQCKFVCVICVKRITAQWLCSVFIGLFKIILWFQKSSSFPRVLWAPQ